MPSARTRLASTPASASAKDLTREQVQHNGQIQPAFIGSDVGDICHPSAIWLPNVELALQMIGRYQ